MHTNTRPTVIGFVLGLLALPSLTLASDPFDGMTLSAARGPSAGDVTLQWTGGQPTFKIYRAVSPSGVATPANLIGESSVRNWVDAPPPGGVFFYVIKSPCVYNPPEICNGTDDDCNGSVDEGVTLTFYQDADLDGYGNPNIAIQACSPPVGYVTTGTDCNDGDPGIHPGAAETCDGLDNDCNGTPDSPPPPCTLEHATATCLAGACAVTSCDSGFGNCNGSNADGCEVNLAADAANCGGCGAVCSGNNVPSPTCGSGTCNGACAAGFGDCNGNKQTDGCEVNLAADAANCGACGAVCSGNNIPSPTCGSGTCNGACAAGFGDCNGNKQTDGCEVNLAADAANCGGCGAVCSGNHVPSPTCGSGNCNGACAAGFGDCNGNKQTDGCEVNLAADAANCGACGMVCSGNNIPSPTCGSGTCNGACAAGFGDCNGNKQTDGCEVNLAADAANCGGCGAVCSGNHVPSPTCGSGNCNGACAAGFGDCNGNKQTDGCEVNLAADAANCGACGMVCSGNHVPSPMCGSGTCNGACAAGFGDCNGNKQSDGCEVNLAADAANCGACGAVCSGNHVPSPTCGSGTCNGACAAGFGDCNGNKQTDGCEVNLAADAANCGACGMVCSGNHVPSPTCGSGTCNGACAAGFGDCNGNKQTDGCEVNLAADAANCGGCGAVCSGNNIPSPTCGSGTCNGACAAGFGDCNGNKQTDGCEVNLAADAANCGACGMVCSGNHVPSPTCGSGTCNGACAAGYGDCNGNKQTDGCEVNLAADAANCGGCGAVCSGNNIPSPTCGSGTCNGACAAGFGDCNGNKQTDGCEVNLAADAANCGACGAVCSGNNVPSPTCGSGTCNGACAAGFGDCNGNKQTDGCEVNLAADAANCGGCGAVCSGNNVPSPTCGSGTCNGACAAGFGDCNGNKQTDGCEVNLAADAANCGACGFACELGAVCSGSACSATICQSASLVSFAVSGPAPVLIASSSNPATNKVVFFAQNSVLRAIRISIDGPGTIKWTWNASPATTINNFPSPVPIPNGMGGFNDYIYLTGDDGFLYKIDAETGTLSASANLKRASCASDSIIATPTIQLYDDSSATFKNDMDTHGHVGDSLIIVVTRNQCGDATRNRIVAYYGSDLAVKWTFNADGSRLVDYFSEGCSLDYATDRMYCGTDLPSETSGQNSLWSLNAIDGSVVWAAQAGAILNRPMLRNGALYVGTKSGLLTKRSTVDGSAIWSVPVGGSGVSITRNPWAEPRPGGTAMVLVVDSTGTLHALHDAGATATKVWSTPTGIVYTSMPVVSPSLSKVWIGRNDGKVQQIDLADGHNDASVLVGPGSVYNTTLETNIGGTEIDRLNAASVGPGAGTFGRFCVAWVNGMGEPPQRPPCVTPGDCAAWAAACDSAACQTALGVCHAVPSNEGGSCTNDLGCAATSVCRGGRCDANSYASCPCVAAGDRSCSSPTTVCCGSFGCANTASDPANCGGCGLTCGPDQICVTGVCKRNTSVCLTPSAATLNGLSGSVRGVDSIAFDRQGSNCNAYLATASIPPPSKVVRVTPAGGQTSWTNPAVDSSGLTGLDVAPDGRAVSCSIANEVLGVPPSYTPGTLFVDPSTGSPSIPLTTAKTYSNQPWTIQTLNQGPVGPVIDTSTVVPGIGGARSYTAYFANWIANGDLYTVKRDCSITPSCTWSASAVPGWAPLPQRITAIAFGRLPGGHRGLYVGHGTVMDVFDIPLILVVESVDLATAYVPVPGSGTTPVKSIRSLSVDPLYGDVYVDVGDLGGLSQILMIRKDDRSVRNLRHVALDLVVSPVPPFTFSTEGRLPMTPEMTLYRLVPKTSSDTTVTVSQYALSP